MQYPKDVLSSKVKAGLFIRQACQRFMDDLKRPDLSFRRKAVDCCISFIGCMRHGRAQFSGKPFELLPWQQWIIANIVGFYWKGTNRRRFGQSYIEMSRKQGKTALVAALSLYYLVADGEDGAEIDLAANSKEQAKIAFKQARTFAKSIDPDHKVLKAYRDTITLDANDSVMNVFASDDSTLDGYNTSFGVIDEYHSAPDSSVRDVIKSSMGMRLNPHLCTITTAGFDKSLPCYELRCKCVDMLAGLRKDDDVFAAIYEMDEGDDWRDETCWPKCSPNLDVTVSRQWLRAQVNSATGSPREEVNVKTKNLNIWCDSSAVWIPDDYLRKCSMELDWEKFNPDDDLCFVGVDLSAVSDLTAVAYLIFHDDKMFLYVDYYLPREALETKADRETYNDWAQRGLLHVTPGNVTDYDYITQDIIRHNKYVTIVKVGYDKWNATQWAIDCTSLGMPLEEYPQTLGNFNRPTREMERLILSGQILMDNNDITRFCFRNVELKSDWNGNVKPIKDVSKKKIDGVIASLEALGCALINPATASPLLVT